MSTRPRLEAFVWVQVICVAFSAIPGALKTISWGGGGLTVIGATGSFIEDRVAFAVFLPMVVPMTLFLARQAILLPRTRWLILALRGIAISCILALVGTFARTALFSGGTAFLLLVAKTKNKIWMVLVAVAAIVLLFELAPASWFERMDTTVNYQHDESALDRLEAWKWSWNMALRHPLVGGGFRVEVLNKVPGGDGYIESHNIVFEVLVEHGFIGLALFGALIAAAYRSCGTVRRLAIDQPDLAWAQDLAGMVQVSLLVFVAGGMFISIATSPFLYDLVSITIGLRSIAEWQRAGLRPATSRLAMPLAPPLAVP